MADHEQFAGGARKAGATDMIASRIGYGAMELSKTLGNSLMALPFTVIVDREGGVVHTQLGPLKEAQLAAIMQQLL